MTQKRPTLKTVAEYAQVSLPTVSQVMRGVGRISKDTRKKVLQAADAVGYIPDDRAVSVRTGRSNEIAIIVHDIGNHFNAEVIDAVSNVIEAHGYFLSIMDAKGEPARLEKLVRIVLSRTCAGLLWVPSERMDEGLVELIEKQKIPNVTFLRGLTNSKAPSLRIANQDATKRAAEFLRSLGHHRICYAGGIGENQTRRQRVDGYLTAMEGLTTLILDAKDTKAGGFEYAKTLVYNHPDVTAVLCNGDEFAIGLCLGLQRLGKTPGQDLSVVGFDDIDEAELITPSLTTLSISPVNFGEKLAELLLQEITLGRNSNKEHFVNAVLMERESTSACNKRPN